MNSIVVGGFNDEGRSVWGLVVVRSSCKTSLVGCATGGTLNFVFFLRRVVCAGVGIVCFVLFFGVGFGPERSELCCCSFFLVATSTRSSGDDTETKTDTPRVNLHGKDIF